MSPARLSALDAAFLSLECRLGRAPRDRQKLASGPLGLGDPVWVDDPSCDIAEHAFPARDVRTSRCNVRYDDARTRAALGAAIAPAPLGTYFDRLGRRAARALGRSTDRQGRCAGCASTAVQRCRAVGWGLGPGGPAESS